jgi:NAD(P)-dependent dehydrogenase (short-subunit alcohol dehydrogenase family)
MTTKWTEADVPDQLGRVALVTGANSGIGYEAARALAQHGAHVVLACRNRSKAESALNAIDALRPSGTTEILDMDLADLDSVAEGAAKFSASHDRLDLLINNAGLMAVPRSRTVQGFEMQFGVNHLAHFALTGRLLDPLLATAQSRVVTISSTGHRAGKIHFDDLNWERRYRPWFAYFQSKLANLLFTSELQRRLDASVSTSTIATAAHPGGSATNLGNDPSGGWLKKLTFKTQPLAERLVLQSAAMGALPTLRAAVDPDARGDDYYGPDGFMEQRGHPVKVGRTKRAQDLDTALRLWTISAEATGVSYDALG